MNIEEIMQKAFNLGQTYWQQADSDSSTQWKKSELTLEKFKELSLSVFTDVHQASLQLDDLKFKNSQLLEALEIAADYIHCELQEKKSAYGDRLPHKIKEIQDDLDKAIAAIKSAKGE